MKIWKTMKKKYHGRWKNSIQHEDNLENMKIEEGDEANDDINKEEIVEDDERVIIDIYVTEEDLKMRMKNNNWQIN